MSGKPGPGDTLAERFQGSHYRLVLLMRVNRWYITLVILLVTVLILVFSSKLGLSPIRFVAVEQNSIQALYSSLILAIITGTTIVVTISQLVLSQELGSAGEQYERMEEALEFRKAVENVVRGVSHPEPSVFLADHIDGIQQIASQLQMVASDEDNEDLQADVDEYVDELVDNAESVKEPLFRSQFSDFEFIWQTLNFDYAWKIYRARQIAASYPLKPKTETAFDDLIEALTLYGPAREHFKTLYFQWALINLSRAVLYISIPALIILAVLLMFVGSTTLPGSTLGVENVTWLVSAGITVGMSPFVVFTVYIIRIATVAKQTLASGPFVLQETGREYDR